MQPRRKQRKQPHILWTDLRLLQESSVIKIRRKLDEVQNQFLAVLCFGIVENHFHFRGIGFENEFMMIDIRHVPLVARIDGEHTFFRQNLCAFESDVDAVASGRDFVCLDVFQVGGVRTEKPDLSAGESRLAFFVKRQKVLPVPPQRFWFLPP